jgi:hypothetical protein
VIPVFANVAVPLFFPQPLLALLALLPIVGLETLLLKRQARVAIRDVLIANVFSAIWGIPLAMVSTMLLGVTGIAALDRYYTTLLDVTLVLSALILPCLLLSVLLEGWYLRDKLSGLGGRTFWLAVARANCHSYLLLLVIYCVWIRIQLLKA